MILSKYKPSAAVQKTKNANGAAGLLTVINSKRNGKRLEIRKEVAEKLGILDEVAVAYDNNSAILFVPTAEEEVKTFKVRKSGSKFIVYSTQLVDEITKFFALDFTSTVCHTFVDGEYEVYEETNERGLVISKKPVANEEQDVSANV